MATPNRRVMAAPEIMHRVLMTVPVTISPFILYRRKAIRSMMTKTTPILPALAAVLLVTAMAAAAELSGQREILFPELAAVAAGALAFPRFAWNVSLPRMLLCLTGGALLGSLLAAAWMIPFVLRLCLAFLAGLTLLVCSRTGFAPMISAVVLPVMLESRSAVYPVSAAVLSGAAVLLCLILSKRDDLRLPEFAPLPRPGRSGLLSLALHWAMGCFVILFAVRSGLRLIAAPPLLVAYTEFQRSDSPAQRMPLRICLLLAACGGIGAALRYPAVYFGVWQFPWAGVAFTAVLLLLHRTRLYCPPAAALALLAFLIPEQELMRYPAEILSGALFFTGLAVLRDRTGVRAREK